MVALFRVLSLSDRRKLHNTIQELKGNVRVFCRVRPLLGDEQSAVGGNSPAHIGIPDKDCKTLQISTLSDANYAGDKSEKKYEFSFDKVFGPSASQADVFDEISQLVQSCLDGYNVCIFAYGQTGSGKTHTMEGQLQDPELRGMIPRAVEQIFDTASGLEEKGWKYSISVSFVEVRAPHAMSAGCGQWPRGWGWAW